ncbi:amidohydrolase [Clostridium sp. CM027]|uniref:amidohydrolase n=1 Tax=Clostridium sp. CM027 TaxID=2849865 RepID=UPI001C6EEBEF|nr:amidohydrolase [Clostridium sp. CM027]MBW9145980.1 amidohydrolase [Clostridium sp. CM027]UVE39451.1 amidohydrolase [Clostridium sp. CM027]
MILIKNANIHSMANKDFENGMILIDHGKIIAIANDVNPPRNAEIIDVKNKFVMPGMIDAHCHLGMWEDGMGFEGADGNEAVDPVTPHLRAIDAINPMDICFKDAIDAGITTVATGPGSANVIGGQFTVIKTYGNRIDDMIVNECLAMKVAFGENPKRVYHAQKKSPSTRMGTAAILRENLIKAKMYIEKQNKALENPDKMPEFDMKMEALAKVIKKEIPLKAHAHRADDILTALRVAKEFNIDITLDHCTEGHLIIDYLKEGIQKGVILGPSLSNRSKVELKNLTFKTPGILSKAGIKVAIMTDHPVIPLQYLPVCAGIASREGMDEEEALKAITINAAEILGIDGIVGSLEIGKDADIVIYSGHPFDLRSKVALVMVNGEIVKNEISKEF